MINTAAEVTYDKPPENWEFSAVPTCEFIHCAGMDFRVGIVAYKGKKLAYVEGSSTRFPVLQRVLPQLCRQLDCNEIRIMGSTLESSDELFARQCFCSARHQHEWKKTLDANRASGKIPA
jgi:hypothetical protein